MKVKFLAASQDGLKTQLSYAPQTWSYLCYKGRTFNCRLPKFLHKFEKLVQQNVNCSTKKMARPKFTGLMITKKLFKNFFKKTLWCCYLKFWSKLLKAVKIKWVNLHLLKDFDDSFSFESKKIKKKKHQTLLFFSDRAMDDEMRLIILTALPFAVPVSITLMVFVIMSNFSTKRVEYQFTSLFSATINFFFL